MIIAFSGLDGTGKTTYSKETVKFLKSRGIKARYVQLYQFSLLCLIGRLFPSKAKKRIMHSQLSRKTSPFLIFLRKIIYFKDLFIFYFISGIYSLRNISLVCDRYFYDMLVHMDYLQKKSSFFTRVYSSMIRKPDVFFLLMTNPETAYKRKREYNLDYFREKQGLYLKIESNHAYIIKDGTLSENQKLIEKIIMEKIR